MYRLRPEQIAALQALEDAGFEKRAITHLREKLPEGVLHGMDADELRHRLRKARDRAAAHGLTEEYGIVCYLDAALLLGEDFERKTEYQDIIVRLKSDVFEADEKADALLVQAQEAYEETHPDFEPFDADEFLD